MPEKINIVFSQLPDGVTEEEFNHWYDAHLDEILAIPGFVSAQRYRIEPAVVDPEVGVPYQFIALFGIEGEFDDVMQAMADRNLSSADSYVELKKTDEDGPALPEWWGKVRFASWNCTAVGERVEATA